MSLLRAVVLVLCVILGFYFWYYFPVDVLGAGYGYLVIAALLLYPVGALVAFAGTDRWRTDRLLGLAGLSLMGVAMVLLATTQWEFFFLVFVAPFAALVRVYFGIVRALIAVLAVHLLLASIFDVRWDIEGIWLQSPLYMLFTLSTVVLTHLMMKEGEARMRLAQLHDELQAAQQLLTSHAIDRERLRISRDLHDSLGHHLTALSIQLEVASHHADEKAGASIAKARSIAKSLLSEVRDVVGSLRTESEIGLRESLEHLVAGAQGRVGLEIDDSFSALDQEVDETVFRVVQEILTNNTRHSQAAGLTIRLEDRPGEWVVAANDTGNEPVHIEVGSGLRGMKERVEALGGALTLETDRGLRHLVRIPKERRHDPGSPG